MTMPEDVTPSDFARLEEKNVALLLDHVDQLAAALNRRADRLASELRVQTDQIAADLRTRADNLTAALVATELHARVEALTIDMRAIDMRDQVQQLSDELRKNSAATKRVEENTKGLVEAVDALRGGMKVLDWIGKVGVRLLWITVPAAMLYGAWQALKLWAITKL